MADRYDLAPGWYWVDVYPDERLGRTLTERLDAIQIWAKNSGAVIARTVSHTDETPERAWLLFEMTRPARFPGALGLPTAAPGNAATSEEDTVQRPDVDDWESPLDTVADVGKGIRLIGAALLTVGMVVILNSAMKNRRF